MRILIEQGGHAFQNLGDWAMLEVAVRRLQHEYPHAELGVFGHDVERIRDCVPGVIPICNRARQMVLESGCLLGRFSSPLGNIDRMAVQSMPRMGLPLVKWRQRMRSRGGESLDRCLDWIQSADCVIASGGGYMTDAFPRMVNGVGSVLHTAQSLGKPTAMFGQGLGPLDKPALRKVARGSLARLHVLGLREGLTSPKLARELGVDPAVVQVTGDDAIELAYESRPVTLGDSLGVNVRIAAYAGIEDDIRIQLRQTISSLITRLKCPVEVVPISMYKHEDDEAQTRELIGIDDVPCAEPVAVAHDAICRAGRCRLMITGSYHAGVFALAQGIPTLGLACSAYYQDKFHGLADQFGPGAETVLLQGDGWSDKLLQRAEFMWQNSDILRPGLLSRAVEQIDLSRSAYQKMFELMQTSCTV